MKDNFLYKVTMVTTNNKKNESDCLIKALEILFPEDKIYKSKILNKFQKGFVMILCILILLLILLSK